MIKTSTTKTNVNSSKNPSDFAHDAKLESDLDTFYSQIGQKLEELKRDPSAQTIQNILNYSKNK